MAANRGPVSFHGDPNGEPVVTRGAGGLVTVLTEVLRQHEGVWVAMALSDEEAELAARGQSVDGRPSTATTTGCATSPLDPEAYHQYYNIVANPMLWFIQHYLWDLGWHPDIARDEIDAWGHGYVPVNRAFAEAVIDELGGDAGRGHAPRLPPLPRRPGRARGAAATGFLHQFVHIPWASPTTGGSCRATSASSLRGLLANDVVAFHTEHYVRNFLHGCWTCSTPRSTTPDASSAWRGARSGCAPIRSRSTPRALRAAAARSAPRRRRSELLARRREYLVVRVDRIDLSKNILRGFKAFDRFLDLHPEFREHITFFALLQPSREDVEEYVEYLERVERVVAEMNTQARHDRLDADRPAHPGQLPRDARGLQELRRAAWSTRSSTA